MPGGLFEFVGVVLFGCFFCVGGVLGRVGGARLLSLTECSKTREKPFILQKQTT